MTERTAQLGARFAPGVTSPNPRRPTRLENPSRRALFFASKRGLQPRGLGPPRKNLHVCVLNLAGSVSGHGVFINPQVDGLRDFRLLPLSELKRKRAPFFRASRPKDARDPPLRAGIPAPGAALPSAYCIQPTTLPSAHGPPRLYTPGARDFPLTGTSVAHDPSRICTLDVHGFSCAAQCAPSAPTFLAGLRFSIRCRASARQTRGASRHSSGRPSTGALFTLAYSASPAFASTSVTSVMVKSGTARRGSSLASWSSSANEQQGAPGQLKSGSSLRRS